MFDPKLYFARKAIANLQLATLDAIRKKQSQKMSDFGNSEPQAISNSQRHDLFFALLK